MLCHAIYKNLQGSSNYLNKIDCFVQIGQGFYLSTNKIIARVVLYFIYAQLPTKFHKMPSTLQHIDK